jgi:hypothetical protein
MSSLPVTENLPGLLLPLKGFFSGTSATRGNGEQGGVSRGKEKRGGRKEKRTISSFSLFYILFLTLS